MGSHCQGHCIGAEYSFGVVLPRAREVGLWTEGRSVVCML